MTQSREQFEARYPIPTGVEWSEEEGRYRPIDGKYVAGFSVRQYEAYIAAWSVWKASREDVVVILPEIKNQDWACGSDMCEAMRHGVTLSKNAISAAGVRAVQTNKDVSIPKRTCHSCGAEGWTANCDECIPY